jgi:hypothetical protein
MFINENDPDSLKFDVKTMLAHREDTLSKKLSVPWSWSGDKF